MKYTYPGLGERDILVSYYPVQGATGVDRVACIAQDITERKLAEQVLSTVSQRLIEAQEQERSRLARELHDDINQRLALLASSLEGLKLGLPSSAATLRRQIGEMSSEIAGVASDVQALSHRLPLAEVGAPPTHSDGKELLQEFADSRKLEINSRTESVPKHLPLEISLCLFRVLQEALQNASKHSGSPCFEVELTGGQTKST